MEYRRLMSLAVMIAFAALWASSVAAQTATQHGGAVSSGINIPGRVAQGGGSVDFDSPNGRTVTGKPLSATEEHRTVQILADGTRIENTATAKFYRDGEGRTRIQRMDGSAVIHDPLQGVPDQVGPDGRVLHSLPARYDGPLPIEAAEQGRTPTPESPVTAYEEDLGSQSVNGVIAHGSRTTTTIPVGQIGNDRPIRIVSERWYSTDLEMNVKTITSDPRYGETTYQLTDIHQGVQNATLFRHPTSAHPQQ
jgi:hypothetical protein